MIEQLNRLAVLLWHPLFIRIDSIPAFWVENLFAIIYIVAHYIIWREVNKLETAVMEMTAIKLEKLKSKLMTGGTLRGSNDFFESKSVILHETTSITTVSLSSGQESRMFTRHAFQRRTWEQPRMRDGSSLSTIFLANYSDPLKVTSTKDKIRYLLKVSPSQYVKKEAERNKKKNEIISCMESLSVLLERVLIDKSIRNVPRESIVESLVAIQEHFGPWTQKKFFTPDDQASMVSLIMGTMKHPVNNRSLNRDPSANSMTSNSVEILAATKAYEEDDTTSE